MTINCKTNGIFCHETPDRRPDVKPIDANTSTELTGNSTGSLLFNCEKKMFCVTYFYENTRISKLTDLKDLLELLR